MAVMSDSLASAPPPWILPSPLSKKSKTASMEKGHLYAQIRVPRGALRFRQPACTGARGRIERRFDRILLLACTSCDHRLTDLRRQRWLRLFRLQSAELFRPRG